MIAVPNIIYVGILVAFALFLIFRAIKARALPFIFLGVIFFVEAVFIIQEFTNIWIWGIKDFIVLGIFVWMIKVLGSGGKT